jgi:mono/diheme cytochrome c family protein
MRFVAFVLLATVLVPQPPSYTDAQATKGQILFYENCAECHGARLEGNIGPALAGEDGNVQWETVTYVWGYMTAHMPAGNANGLRPDEYLEIMAFLLKVHGHLAGRAPLTAPEAAASKALMGP